MARRHPWHLLLPTRALLPALLLAMLPAAQLALAAPPPLASPPASDPSGCDHFARLFAYAQQSKAMCEEGRQVKAGPITAKIVARCHAEQGARFDHADVSDLMDTLAQQIQSQGIGNACNAASQQAWTLISQ